MTPHLKALKLENAKHIQQIKLYYMQDLPRNVL